ncbi:hypothetical protein AK812_SmicGene48376, partial [Symbiodinium microadriaticum]
MSPLTATIRGTRVDGTTSPLGAGTIIGASHGMRAGTKDSGASSAFWESGTMSDFSHMLDDIGIPPPIVALLAAFDTALFARACASPAELDELISEFTATAAISEHAEKVVVRAGLRLLCSKCRLAEGLPSLEGSAPPTSSGDFGTAPTTSTPGPPALLSSSWQESWPAKLSPERTSELRKRFEDDYPTELLDSESFPSARLLALTNKMLTDKEVRWLPWKFRLSSKSQEDSLM